MKTEFADEVNQLHDKALDYIAWSNEPRRITDASRFTSLRVFDCLIKENLKFNLFATVRSQKLIIELNFLLIVGYKTCKSLHWT